MISGLPVPENGILYKSLVYKLLSTPPNVRLPDDGSVKVHKKRISSRFCNSRVNLCMLIITVTWRPNCPAAP